VEPVATVARLISCSAFTCSHSSADTAPLRSSVGQRFLQKLSGVATRVTNHVLVEAGKSQGMLQLHKVNLAEKRIRTNSVAVPTYRLSVG
jgi:hypothetical protein